MTDNPLPVEGTSIVGCDTTTAAVNSSDTPSATAATDLFPPKEKALDEQNGTSSAIARTAVMEDQEVQVSTAPQEDASLVTAEQQGVSNDGAALTVTTSTNLDEEPQQREPGSTVAENGELAKEHLDAETIPEVIETDAQRRQVLCPPSIATSNLLNYEDAVRIMTSVLLHCAAQRHTVGEHARRVANVECVTDTRKIRANSKKLADRDFDNAVDKISRNKTARTGLDIQDTNDESWYWEIIRKGAKLLDPTTLKFSKGPLDGFSVAEKEKTREFMEKIFLATGSESQRLYRGYIKLLFDIREAGVERITCYRTNEFDRYCKIYPKTKEPSLIDTIMSWEKVYGQHIDQLEVRIRAKRSSDFSGQFILEQPYIAGQVDMSDMEWNDGSNEWRSALEEIEFISDHKVPATSSMCTVELFSDSGAHTETFWNKSTFISLFPVTDTTLWVCPIIPVFRGDFLGLFAGEVRFCEDQCLSSIPGPMAKLWLDYSEVTGTLNQMHVAENDQSANVDLIWEAVDGQDGIGQCETWRVMVLAKKDIMPFEQLVRLAYR